MAASPPPAADHFIVHGLQASERCFSTNIKFRVHGGRLTSTQGHAHSPQIPPALVCKSTLRPN